MITSVLHKILGITGYSPNMLASKFVTNASSFCSYLENCFYGIHVQ